MSDIFNLLSNNNQDLVFLLLLLPIVATLVAFARQVIGISMFGAYAPIITAYAFIETKLIPGLIISLIIFLTSMILKFLTQQLRIHYLPRMAILLSLVSLSVLLILPFAQYFNFAFTGFSVIVLITLSDIYLTSQIQKGYKKAGRLYLETIIVSSLIYFLATWRVFQGFLVTYPEIVVLAIIIDIIMGRWSGLRINEIYRFRTVIKEKSKDYA